MRRKGVYWMFNIDEITLGQCSNYFNAFNLFFRESDSISVTKQQFQELF